MGAGLREIKRRIKSVQSTKKITRAMELIAASRVLKAQQRMQAARPYVEAMTAALQELTTTDRNLTHEYLRPRSERRNAAVIVVTSDRGLAGPYSSNVVRQGEELFARLRNEGVEPKLFVTGRKGSVYYRFRQRPVEQVWTGFSEMPTFDSASEVAQAALDAYLEGKVDEIYIVSTQFVSPLTQRAAVRRLLPIDIVERGDSEAKSGTETAEHAGSSASYEYEPDAATVLDRLLPRYVRVRVYTAFLEAAASEQASRRKAMSTATENATTLIDEYTRQYNRARQAEITQELMEVVGAAEAFTGSK